MKALPIKENVYYVGVQNPDLRVFDIVMKTEYGTSYNAFVIKGQEKNVLIETVKSQFFEEYLEKVEEVLPLADIDYLIVNHTEPDHSGSIAYLLDKAPHLTILGSSIALSFLKKIVNKKFATREVRHGEILALGGKTLQFISSPFLHWPDSMYTYLIEDKILFSIDSFGSHFSDERVFNDLIEQDYSDAFKYYFDVIMGPFKPYVQEALQKIKELEINIIAPGHGPILRSNIDAILQAYDQWSRPVPREKDTLKIVLPYVTAYGYTGILLDNIVEGIQAVLECDIIKFNLVYSPVADVLQELENADALLIGSPTLIGDAPPPIWQLLTSLSPVVHHHLLAAAFGSYGWSGEAVPNIENRLQSLRMKVFPGFKVNFKPSETEIEDAFNFGMAFANALKQHTQEPAKKMWRCLICNQSFPGENPPLVCPACGASSDNFVEDMPEEEFTQNREINCLILGSGIAALSAAEALRKRNRLAKITLVSEEPYYPYYRPILSDLLSAEIGEEKLYIHPWEWYEENNIDVLTESRVVKIDPAGKTIMLKGDKTLPYDKLILALGARNNMPPIKGIEKDRVMTLRNMTHLLKIKEALRDSKKIAIIGGGILGLEAASEIHSLDKEVTIIEFSPRIMPRQLDEASSARLEEIMKAKGIRLYMGVSVEEILGDTTANGVKTNAGDIIAADLVLISAGVTPNTELAREAGINVDRAIIVDKQMRTDIPDVLAAGDVAQFNNRNLGLWPVALEMGKIAGSTVAGDWLEYREPPISTLLSAFDKQIFSVGEVNNLPPDAKIVEVIDPAQGYYKKSFFKDGVLLGEVIMSSRVDSAASITSVGRDESGKIASDKWKCKICGYIETGSEPPDECPVCGAAKNMFEPV